MRYNSAFLEGKRMREPVDMEEVEGQLDRLETHTLRTLVASRKLNVGPPAGEKLDLEALALLANAGAAPKGR